MTDLSKVLPTKSATVEAIEAYWLKRGQSEEPRGYLGASSIGAECSRQLWYSFRKCSEPKFDARLYRLFNRGHREEPTFVEELRGIGCEVHEVGADGNQFEVIACDGHFKGHTDGAALGIPEAPKTWHLLEMKTSSAKLFAKVEKEGCEKANPKHFAQMQVYMHLTGLKRALYMVVNKDTDALYTERLRYDKTRSEAIIAKAQSIINATTPPERISDRPDAFACKFCDARELCHGVSEVAVDVPTLHCRQCVHASPVKDGKWHCAKHDKEAVEVCSEHLFLPGLIGFAEPTDSITNADGSSAIEFTSEDGTIWEHGSDEARGQYPSTILQTTSKHLVFSGDNANDGKPDLQQMYSLNNAEVNQVWAGTVEQLKGAFEDRYQVPMVRPNYTQDGDGWSAAAFRGQCCIIISGNSAEIRESCIPF